MYILKLAIIAILLCVMPLLIGTACATFFNDRRGLYKLTFSYTTGIFLMLALFEIVCVPMAYMDKSFSFITRIYSIVLLVVVFLSIFSLKKQSEKKTHIKIRTVINNLSGYSVYTYIYFFIFLSLFIVQIYRTITFSATYIMADDAEYIVYGTDALTNDLVYRVHALTGTFKLNTLRRMLQSINIFYAYIAKLTGLSVTTVAHTIMNVFFLIVAYGVYYMIAISLFGVPQNMSEEKIKNKNASENIWIFLIFISILYIYGYYSLSSLSVRLLSTLWHGKAILAVIITPFLFVLMKKFLVEDYRHRNGVYLLFLSIASISLSLMAFSHILIGVGLTIIIVVCINKKYKNFLYLVWAGIVPTIVGIVYLLEKFLIL